MRLKAIWILCALALGALALVATGCGGGGETTTTVTVESSDSTDTESTETETTEDDTETETTEDDTETETTEDDTETEATDTDTNPDLSFLTSENCREFIRFASSLSQALSGTGDQDVQEAADAMQEFADQAPEDIRDDFQVLADAYSKIADALEGVDLGSGETPPAEALAKLMELSQELNSTELTEASQNISDWTTENCTNG